jgi:hypothetical protein
VLFVPPFGAIQRFFLRTRVENYHNQSSGKRKLLELSGPFDTANIANLYHRRRIVCLRAQNFFVGKTFAI